MRRNIILWSLTSIFGAFSLFTLTITNNTLNHSIIVWPISIFSILGCLLFLKKKRVKLSIQKIINGASLVICIVCPLLYTILGESETIPISPAIQKEEPKLIEVEPPVIEGTLETIAPPDKKVSEEIITPPINQPEPINPAFKAHAKEVYSELKKMEEYIDVALLSQDYNGFETKVKYPLIRMMGDFPRDNQMMSTYRYCFIAINTLSNIGSDLEMKSGIDRYEELKYDVPDYKREVKECKKAIDQS